MNTNIRRLIGMVILAPVCIPLGIFTMVGVVPVSIIGFPVWLGLTLVEGEPLSYLWGMYKDLYTDFAIFPFKIWLGLEK